MFASLRMTTNATEGAADADWFWFRYVRKMASSLANSNIVQLDLIKYKKRSRYMVQQSGNISLQ